MTVRQQWGVVAAIVAVLGGGLWAGVHFLGDELFPIEVGSRAPDFRARDVRTRRERSMSEYRGNVVLLNIWATWCLPCEREMPSIQRLYRAYAPLGLKVVAVSVDETAGDDSVLAYAAARGLTFDVLHDPQYRIEKDYQATGYPETFIIGRDGVIRKKWIGAADWNAPYNRALIDELLGVKGPVAEPVGASADTAGETLRSVAPHPAGSR